MADLNSILVVGAGNDLMGDDGAGIYVVNQLEALNPPHLDLRNCSTDLFRLATVCQHYEKIILVDAIRTYEPPGSIHWFMPEHAGNYSMNGSAHQLSVMDVLSLLPLMNAHFRDSDFFVAGIEPGNVSHQQGLSAEVQTAADEVVHLLATPKGCRKIFDACASHDTIK